MGKSVSRLDIPLDDQRAAWNAWNLNSARHEQVREVARRQVETVERWLDPRRNLDILDAGCGTGWFSNRLLPYGRVTGTDLSDAAIAEAARRVPQATFIAGDFFAAELPKSGYDVIVALEFLSHVVDQSRLMRRFAELLRVGGTLIIATQNRPILERSSNIASPEPGQLRQWVGARQLRALLGPYFHNCELTSVVPMGHGGFLRFVNSPKLNALAGYVLGAQRVEQLKERSLLGHTLMVRATKR